MREQHGERRFHISRRRIRRGIFYILLVSGIGVGAAFFSVKFGELLTQNGLNQPISTPRSSSVGFDPQASITTRLSLYS